MRLSKHQQRVIAALLELELAHGWSWWSRDAIGLVVDAGGYHATLQMATVAVLKSHGLIVTELSTWPEATRQLVRCSCSGHQWGLTNKGRVKARSLRVLWDEDARKRIQSAKFYNPYIHDHPPLDEDDHRAEIRRNIERLGGDDAPDAADWWKG